MSGARLTSKGQTTIPKKVRDFLHLEAGDRVDFILLDDGRVLLQPATRDVSSLRGMLHRKGMKIVSVEQMNAAIRKRAARNT